MTRKGSEGKKNVARRKRRVAGLFLVFTGLGTLVLLAQYARHLAAGTAAEPARGLGLLGGAVAGGLWSALGAIAVIVPALLILAGAGVAASRSRGRMILEALLVTGIGLLFGAFFHALPGIPEGARGVLGGEVGRGLHGACVGLLGGPAAFLFLTGSLLVVLVALVDFEVPGPGPILPFLASAGRALAALPAMLVGFLADRPDPEEKPAPKTGSREGKKPGPEKGEGEKREKPAGRVLPAAAASEAQIAEPPRAPRPAVAIMDHVAETFSPKPRPARPPKAAGADAGGTTPREYVLPPLSLLGEPPAGGPTVSKELLLENSRTLEAKLADFGVRASVTEVHPGPVITRYELEPAPGVKVGQIANLADDLALAMRAKRIRIVAPIPGKGAVGVELPNPEARTVFLREVLASAAFSEAASPITIGLGKDISGKAFITSLEEMPHLLLAGATGSGKSVSMHVLISSILMKALPEDVRFIMIDPKMLELAVYNDIPHLIRPVVTDPREAAKALRWAIGEMERRYKTLARVGVRNIAGFNEYLAKGTDKTWGDDAAPNPLPLLVIVIDEYADLVLTLGNEVEEPIAKLAQMARAVGIHLVVATQRPSVDVITGVIKANFPSRIAFQVASKVDSRTIMDVNGAEKLLGKGDMLFLKTGRPEPERIHGAFITTEETGAIVDFIKEQCYVVAAAAAAEDPLEEGERAFNGNAEDDLFEEAVKIVVRHQIASVSMLQRRLKVGFSRAGRLMDLMERAGIVGPFEGSKAREVLVKSADLAAAAAAAAEDDE